MINPFSGYTVLVQCPFALVVRKVRRKMKAGVLLSLWYTRTRTHAGVVGETNRFLLFLVRDDDIEQMLSSN